MADRPAAPGAPLSPPTDDLPYEAVSVNGRAMEWKGPLWDAIAEWAGGSPYSTQRLRAVAKVEGAVETAMRLALRAAALPAGPNPTNESLVQRLIAVRESIWWLMQPYDRSRLCKEMDEAIASLRAGGATPDASEADRCTCLPGPSPHGPVGTPRITNPECPIHGSAGAATEAALRQALDSISCCALGGCEGCRNLARSALASAPPEDRTEMEGLRAELVERGQLLTDSTETVGELMREGRLLAKLAAETPQFDNPLRIMEAKAIRDRILATSESAPGGSKERE